MPVAGAPDRHGTSLFETRSIEELAGNSNLSHQCVLDAQQTLKSMGRDISEDDLNNQIAKIAALARPNGPPS
jgi:hypothetical protein